MKYELATEEQIEGFRVIANNWFFGQNPANMFIDCRSASIGAIVEYLANSEGLTVFIHGIEE